MYVMYSIILIPESSQGAVIKKDQTKANKPVLNASVLVISGIRNGIWIFLDIWISQKEETTTLTGIF